MWYLAIGLAARGWESHNLEIWWNSDSFFVSFEVTLSGSRVPGYIRMTFHILSATQFFFPFSQELKRQVLIYIHAFFHTTYLQIQPQYILTYPRNT